MNKINEKLLKKKDYIGFKKSFLKKGAILPIYENWKTQENLLGYARLNYKVSKPKTELSFERASVGQGTKNEGDMVIYKYQRWNITYVDPLKYDPSIGHKERWNLIHRIHFTHNWNIAYFEIVSSNYKS